MNWAKVVSWARQPTTIHGLAVVAAGVAGAIAHLASGNSTVVGICAVVVYALTHLVISDNSADPSSVEKLVEDAVTAIVQSKVNVSVPQITADVKAAVASLATPTPTP